MRSKRKSIKNWYGRQNPYLKIHHQQHKPQQYQTRSCCYWYLVVCVTINVNPQIKQQQHHVHTRNQRQKKRMLISILYKTFFAFSILPFDENVKEKKLPSLLLTVEHINPPMMYSNISIWFKNSQMVCHPQHILSFYTLQLQ